jgi:hypothetical protein
MAFEAPAARSKCVRTGNHGSVISLKIVISGADFQGLLTYALNAFRPCLLLLAAGCLLPAIFLPYLLRRSSPSPALRSHGRISIGVTPKAIDW